MKPILQFYNLPYKRVELYYKSNREQDPNLKWIDKANVSSVDKRLDYNQVSFFQLHTTIKYWKSKWSLITVEYLNAASSFTKLLTNISLELSPHYKY